MVPDSSSLHRPLSDRERRIREALSDEPHATEFYAAAGRCSLAEATVVLMRLERDGAAARGRPGYHGMTWVGAQGQQRREDGEHA